MEEYPLSDKIKATLTRVLLAGGKTKSPDKKTAGSATMPKVQSAAPVAGVNAPMEKSEKALCNILKKNFFDKKKSSLAKSLNAALLKNITASAGSYFMASRIMQRVKSSNSAVAKKPLKAGGAVKPRGSTSIKQPGAQTSTTVSYSQSVGSI